MKRTLQEHISSLEQKIQTLRAQCDDLARPSDERLALTVDLDLAERALEHFRKAFELEQRISG